MLNSALPAGVADNSRNFDYEWVWEQFNSIEKPIDRWVLQGATRVRFLGTAEGITPSTLLNVSLTLTVACYLRRYLTLRDLLRLAPRLYYECLLRHTEEILPFIYTVSFNALRFALTMLHPIGDLAFPLSSTITLLRAACAIAAYRW